MLPTRDPAQDRRPTQTESEGLETNILSKWTGKKKAGVAILTVKHGQIFQRKYQQRYCGIEQCPR